MSDACTAGIDTGFVALGYGRAVVLGIVQGIAELLPISSTAHLRLVPALLGWPDPGSAFSAALQLAALAAVLTYFWSDVREAAVGSLSAIGRRNWTAAPLRLAVGIVLATIPIVIAGWLLSPLLNSCGSPLRSLTVIGVVCLVMGTLLAAAELICRHRRSIEEMRLRDALIVGVAQVGALVPGASRSGSTLTGALFLDLNREDAARFSFLIGVPAIALAGLRELFLLYRAHLPAEGWSILAVGLVTAALASMVTIWGLMRFLERFSTWPFVIYRLLLGLVIVSGVVFAGWA